MTKDARKTSQKRAGPKKPSKTGKPRRKTSKKKNKQSVASIEPPVILQRTPTKLFTKPQSVPSPQANKIKSFQEQLEKLFPAYVYPTLASMGASTVEDAYHLTIEDLNSSPNLNRVLSRKIHSFIQHHAVHKEYPGKIVPTTPYLSDPNNRIPIKTKYAKDFPKFSGRIEDWIKWKTDAIAVLGHND